MIQTIYQPDTYIGNGTLTHYSFSFRILNKSDLLVRTQTSGGALIDLLLDSDYTIADSSVNNTSGGEIILATVLATGTELFLIRQTSLTQLVHIEEGAPFPSSVVEEVFDRLTMFAQELKSLMIVMDNPVPGQILRWNSAGDAIDSVALSTLAITTMVIDVVVGTNATSAVITHNLGNANAKIIGFSSTFHTAFRVVSQTSDTITVELTTEAPAGGGTLTFEVGV